MNYTEAFKRALATFAQAAIAVLLASGLSENFADVGLWQRAGVAGLVALVTLIHRGAQAWLEGGE